MQRYPNRSPIAQRPHVLSWLLALSLVFHSTNAHGQVSGTSARMPRITAGTLVENEDASRWNQVVLLARPRLASGDVSSLPSFVGKAASSLVLSIMATVEPKVDQAGEKRFKLSEVGVGYSYAVDGNLTIITAEDASRLGAALSLVQRQMLSENEKQIEKVRIVARTSTLLLFDTPAILLRDAKHKRYVMRHFVWINSRTGRTATLVWLLEPEEDQLVVVNEPLRWVPAGTKEDRAIHVDGEEISFLGVPSDEAFALEGLPPGRDVQWTENAKRYAGLKEFSKDELRELTVTLNQALSSLKKSNPTGA